MTIYVEPKPGMVINYGYLWARQVNEGLTHGEKFRPSLILAVKQEDDRKMVYVSPVTHTPPFYPEESLIIPMEERTRLGFDTHHAYEAGEKPLDLATPKTSWLMLSEVNKFEWPGTEIRSVPRRTEKRQFYGFISGKFLAAAQNKLRDMVDLKRFKTVAREMTMPRQENFEPQYKAPAPQPARALG